MKILRSRVGRRFAKDQSGVAAIEFAILAIPFFMTIFAIVETALSYTAQQVLSNATARVSRDIRTGVLDPATVSQAQFRDRVCAEIEVMMPSGCPGLHVDVSEYAKFADVPKDIPFTPGGSVDSGSLRYNPGGPMTINNMRVLYEWPVITDILKSRMSNLQNGKVLLFATSTWRNEP